MSESPLHRDRTRLAEYKEELNEAEERLRAARADTSDLRQIVAALEARIERLGPADTDEGGEEATPEELVVQEPDHKEPEPTEPPAPKRAKRRGLKNVLRKLTDDDRRHDADSVLTDLADHPLFADDLPSRQSINNRLFELEEEGHLRRVDRGVYQRASQEVQENAEEPRVQTGEPTRPQKPPGGEFETPRPGHPTNGAGGSLGLALDTKPEGSTPSGSTRT